ncbi:MAG: hypothetical protein K8L97_13660 [Anaerolineae bacterium]|nr:hypothetical protein [Anaerolineae bacterium]
MIRIYLRLAIPLLAIFIALNIAARAFGSTQAPNPVLRGFTEGCEGKPQPCWYGIVPGVTSLAEADRIIRQQNFIKRQNTIVVIYDTFSNSPISSLTIGISASQPDKVQGLALDLTENIRLGDLLIQFDEPDWIDIHDNFRLTDLIYASENGTISLRTGIQSRFYPFQQNFEAIGLLPVKPIYENYSYNWYGFMPSWRYCQRRPLAAFCN